MSKLACFIWSLVLTAFAVWMMWDGIHYTRADGVEVIEGGQIIMVYMLIGGGFFVCYQFDRAFRK